MPHTKCPDCGYEEPFHPYLRDPIADTEITVEEWYRRVRARFGPGVGPDTVLPMRCDECAHRVFISSAQRLPCYLTSYATT